ncbi:MAG: hypothetical protein Q8P95_04490 [bacterium]|nr:hypothetical protein [bacterium]
MPISSPHPILNWTAKSLLVIFSVLIAAVAGYFLVYFWIFKDLGQVFDTSVLKNQIITQQGAEAVQLFLKSQGISVSEESLLRLGDAGSSSKYQASALNAYQAEEAKGGEQDYSYLVYPEEAGSVPLMAEYDPDTGKVTLTELRAE